MTDEMPERRPEESWETIARIIASRDATRLESYLESLPPAEVARAISRLDQQDQTALLTLLDSEEAADILEEVSEAQAVDLIEDLSPKQAAAIVEEMHSDERADLLGDARRGGRRGHPAGDGPGDGGGRPPAPPLPGGHRRRSHGHRLSLATPTASAWPTCSRICASTARPTRTTTCSTSTSPRPGAGSPASCSCGTSCFAARDKPIAELMISDPVRVTVDDQPRRPAAALRGPRVPRRARSRRRGQRWSASSVGPRWRRRPASERAGSSSR